MSCQGKKMKQARYEDKYSYQYWKGVYKKHKFTADSLFCITFFGIGVILSTQLAKI